MHNIFLRKLIQKTAGLAENLEVTTGGEKNIYKSHPFSRGSRYRSYYWDSTVVKECREESYDNMLYRSFPSSLRKISGVQLVRKREKKIQEKIALKRLQAPEVANISVERHNNVTIACVILSNFIILFYFFLHTIYLVLISTSI